MAHQVMIFGAGGTLEQTLGSTFISNGDTVHHVEAVESLDTDTLARRLEAHQPNVIILCPTWLERSDFLTSSTTQWQRALEHNVETPAYILQTLINHVYSGGKVDAIINLSHVAAGTPLRGLSALGTTLSATSVLMKMAALELASYGVRVNSVMLGLQLDRLVITRENMQRLEQDTPLSQDSLEAAAATCVMLASPAGKHLTGQVLDVSGGFLLTKGEGISPFADAAT
jgi:NAD(P)-dependent dehydrogenase (short-subunit alcohol dehydrogenase family)